MSIEFFLKKLIVLYRKVFSLFFSLFFLTQTQWIKICIRCRKFLFTSLCAHLGVEFPTEEKIIFNSTSYHWDSHVHKKNTQYISKFYHYILILNKMITPVIDICDAICCMNKWHLYLRAITLLLYVVDLHLLPSSKYIITKIISFHAT